MRRACPSPSEIEDKLREARVRPTAQRIAIGRFVLCEAEHPTAEEVKRWVDAHFPKMSLATVYNTLGLLARAGLLREVKLPHTGKTVYDSNLETHHHFLDESTGEIVDIPASEIEVRPKLRGRYEVREVEVLLRGRRRG